MTTFQQWVKSGLSISQLFKIGEDVDIGIIQFYYRLGDTCISSFTASGANYLQLSAGFDVAANRYGDTGIIYPTFLNVGDAWLFRGHCFALGTESRDLRRLRQWNYNGGQVEIPSDLEPREAMSLSKVSQSELGHMVEDYINCGFENRGIFSIGEDHLYDSNRSLERAGLVKVHDELIGSKLELSGAVRRRLISEYNLSKIWSVTGQSFFPNDEFGEITEVLTVQEEKK